MSGAKLGDFDILMVDVIKQREFFDIRIQVSWFPSCSTSHTGEIRQVPHHTKTGSKCINERKGYRVSSVYLVVTPYWPFLLLFKAFI